VGYCNRWQREHTPHRQLSREVASTTHTHNCLTAFVRDYPGSPVPEETLFFWIFMEQGKIMEAEAPTVRVGQSVWAPLQPD